jgi:hypothetical protein
MHVVSQQDHEALIRRAARAAVEAALPDFSALPRHVDRRAGAELVTRFFFPVSARTLEVWPLTWRHVNGKAVVATAELFALADAKLSAAPPIRGGKRQMQEAA